MSESLKQTISKLSINQLQKLSEEADEHFKEKRDEKLNRTWQKLIRKETMKKTAEKNNKKIKRTGVILIKRRKENEAN